jgi:hypothetical protein
MENVGFMHSVVVFYNRNHPAHDFILAVPDEARLFVSLAPLYAGAITSAGRAFAEVTRNVESNLFIERWAELNRLIVAFMH